MKDGSQRLWTRGDAEEARNNAGWEEVEHVCIGASELSEAQFDTEHMAQLL